VTPADPTYKEAIARWAANAERHAKVVAFVKDTNDVALALKYARDNNLQVAIRCGGHSASGASSAKDGLVVDLSRYCNYAIADPESRSVRVGGGSVWGTVEKEAIKYGLATVAGSVSHVRKLSSCSRFPVHLTICFLGSRQGLQGNFRLCS
jgi:FAD/FMN-containing dehydrogenase